MNILVEIPARGGSKGVPRKALRKIGGLPLIAYTIRDALAVKGVTKVIVNTDDPMIRDVAVQYGAEVPFLRPKSLAGDDSDLGRAVVYSAKWLQKHEGFKADVYIIMSPTNPFRRKNIINDSLQMALDDERIFNVGSVAPVHVSLNNLWVFKNDQLRKFTDPIHNKADAVGLCQSSLSFNIVLEFRSNDIPDRHIPVLLNDIEAIDIDEPLDLLKARAVIDNNLYPIINQQKTESSIRVKSPVSIFNKTFNVPPVSSDFRIIRHADFPLINETIAQEFSEYARKQNEVVVTGSPTHVHPYRLKYVDKQGFSNYFYEIDQTVRGNRHCYPEVFSFVPALIAIPKGVDLREISSGRTMMFRVDRDKLFDLSRPVERLLAIQDQCSCCLENTGN